MSPTFEELRQTRIQKLKQLEEIGIKPYPNDFKPTISVSQIRKLYQDKSEEELQQQKDTKHKLAGRIMTIRVMGKASFFHFKDGTGTLQAYIRKDVVGDETYKLFKKLIDIGDIVGVVGPIMKTRTGELTLFVEEFKLLVKALRPLPEKYHGLQDLETRLRRRYLDLIVNDDVRELFRTRTKIVKFVREFLDERGFLEVETPMMHPIPGGAAARPFITHHNALDMDLYLRIAPELYLKRLLVGGFEKVYEINRNFRNEGISAKHNPEFTMLEFYWAYATYEDLMELTQELILSLARHLYGEEKVRYEDGWLDISPPWERMTLKESLIKVGGLAPDKVDDPQYLKQELKKFEVEPLPGWGVGKLQVEVYERAVEPKLIKPTFITHHPVEVSPLSRRNEEDPSVVDRFELIAAGREIANAFSELNDPRDQRARFEEQVKARQAGDEEAHVMDEDFLEALEYGMPPAAGEGIGIDRLVMFMTGKTNIREVILFPLLRPQQTEE